MLTTYKKWCIMWLKLKKVMQRLKKLINTLIK